MSISTTTACRHRSGRCSIPISAAEIRKPGRSVRALALSLLMALATTTHAMNTEEALTDAWNAYEDKNYTVAVEIWSQLAERGNASAQLSLGSAYDYGRGVARDAALAVQWYRAAARQGHGGAQHNLGLMYALGQGVMRDLNMAALWYEKAAEQGLAPSQYNLGMLYVEGDGATRDFTAALHWLRRAAAQQHADAQYNLGIIYAMGRGVPPDLTEAGTWLSMAAEAYLQKGNQQNARNAYLSLRRHVPTHPALAKLITQIGDVTDTDRASLSWETQSLSVGTGWPVTGGYVVTNLHVVAGSEHITLLDIKGEEIEAAVDTIDEENDLALLKVIDIEKLPPALPLSKHTARLGSSVFTIGYPRIDVMGKSPKLSNGIISGERGFMDNPRIFQISVPIQSGNSGGPLINMQGEVVGIVTSMLGTASQNGSGDAMPMGTVSYAVKVPYLIDLLNTLPATGVKANKVAATQPGDLESLAGTIQASVLIVMAK